MSPQERARAISAKYNLENPAEAALIRLERETRMENAELQADLQLRQYQLRVTQE
ncbi:MAG: hypothetical protein KME59_21340 [Trichormus sp. ATA11-4-KO1]|jgi:hypothetical protein|nr:hypothetical protein [Trichormus sp. ATA11-4-KO1]